MNSITYVAVTGAGGFVGKNISNYLSKNSKYKIFAYTRKLFNQRTNKIEYIKRNLSKPFSFDNKISILIHCASSTPPKKNEKKCYQDNFLIDKNILSAINRSNIKKIIFLSSISVYRKRSGNKINENSLLEKKNLYSLSKINMEKKLKNLSMTNKKINIITIRLSGVLGVGSHSNFISELYKIYKSPKIKVIKIFNSSKFYNSNIHIIDFCKIISKLLKIKLKKNYEIFNIFSKNPIKWKKIYLMFQKILNSNIIITESKQKKIYYLLTSNKIKKYKIHLPKMQSTIFKYLKGHNI